MLNQTLNCLKLQNTTIISLVHQILYITALSAEKFIEQTNLEFDLVYIDPSRRDEHSRKVHRLADCSPDITSSSADDYLRKVFSFC